MKTLLDFSRLPSSPRTASLLSILVLTAAVLSCPLAASADDKKPSPTNKEQKAPAPPPAPATPAKQNNEENGGGDKVTICHKGHTISISRNALDAHLAHGDTIGSCEITPTKRQ
jgi:hypothetical protein